MSWKTSKETNNQHLGSIKEGKIKSNEKEQYQGSKNSHPEAFFRKRSLLYHDDSGSVNYGDDKK